MDRRTLDPTFGSAPPARPDQALERASLALSRMDQALSALRSRSAQSQPASSGHPTASSSGARHEHR